MQESRNSVEEKPKREEIWHGWVSNELEQDISLVE